MTSIGGRTIMAVSFALVFLAGCAAGAGMRIRWERYAIEELQRVCGAPRAIRVVGCYARVGDSCVVRTWDQDPELHDTLGHEVRHCFEGAWHK